MPLKVEFVVHGGDDDDDDGGDYGYDDMMALGQEDGAAFSSEVYARGKRKSPSPVVLSPGPPIRTGTPSLFTLKTYYSRNYSMDYEGRIPNLETEIEMYEMINDESISWIGEKEDDDDDDEREHDFLYAILEGPRTGTNYFIKKFDCDRSALLWKRESINLQKLMDCEHVPIFYCSLSKSNKKKSEFFIITENCEKFDEEIDKPLLKNLPDYLDVFHSFNYFHGDLGNPENIMVAIREGQRDLVFIDLDDTYGLEENHTKDTEPTEGKPLSRDDKISAFKFVETDNPEVDEKKYIFMACDRFSLMHSLLTLLGLKELLPGMGENHSQDGGYNCLWETTRSFYKSFIPNFKIVTTERECRDPGLVGNGNIFWNFEDTLRLVPIFNTCYEIFRVNLLNLRNFTNLTNVSRDLFDGVIESELEPEPELDPEVEDSPFASMNRSFARKKSKKKKTNRKNKKLKKSRRKTNRKNKKLKTKKSRRKTKRKYKR